MRVCPLLNTCAKGPTHTCEYSWHHPSERKVKHANALIASAGCHLPNWSIYMLTNNYHLLLPYSLIVTNLLRLKL